MTETAVSPIMSRGTNVLGNNETHIGTIPVEYKEHRREYQIGSILVSDKRVLFRSNYDDDVTKTFEELPLDSEPFAQFHDGELHAVFVPQPDGEDVKNTHSHFISEIEERTGYTYFMDIIQEHGQNAQTDPEDCSCQRISSNNVLVENENMELGQSFSANEFRLVSCEDCYSIYGVYKQGKKTTLRKMMTADWLLGGDTSLDSIVEFGNTDAFGLHYRPSSNTRLRDLLLTISMVAERSNDISSTFKHQYQQGLLYLVDDEVVGYLSWETHDRGPILSQIYVRESHRGEGHATRMVQGWFNQLCDSNQYFADELTEGGRAVLDNAEHLDGDDHAAKEVISLTPLGFG